MLPAIWFDIIASGTCNQPTDSCSDLLIFLGSNPGLETPKPVGCLPARRLCPFHSRSQRNLPAMSPQGRVAVHFGLQLCIIESAISGGVHACYLPMECSRLPR